MFKLFLANRNFRNLTLFSTFGGVGRGLFSIFMMWAIHAMYQNTVYTGIAGFMFGVPLVAGFLVGPFVDRWNKTIVLRLAEFTKFCVVAVMLMVHLYFYVGVWFYFLCIFIFSAAAMFSSPAFTALLPRVVDGEDLVTANATMNIFGIIGGLGLGAIIIAMPSDELDFAWLYGITAVLLFIAALFTFIFRYKQSATENYEVAESKTLLRTYFGELGEGFSFIKRGALLFFTAAIMGISFFGDIAYVNFPRLIDVRLGSASGYMLFSFLALMGNMIGSFICKVVESKFKLRKILVAAFVFAGAARIMFVITLGDNFTRAILMYLIYIGFGSVIGIFYHVLIQKLPPKNLTGRVDAATRSVSAVAAAIGALAGGFLGTALYVDTVFFIQGGAYLVIAILLCLSKKIRSLPKISEIGKDE